MSQEIINTIKKAEELVASPLPKFDNLQLVDHNEQDLKDINERLIKCQDILYSRLAENGLDRVEVLSLRKEDYPSLFRFFRLRNIQNLIPTKIEE
jgi:hypothetical protein